MRLGFLLVGLMWAFTLLVAFAASAHAGCPPWEAQDVCYPPRSELTWPLIVMSVGGAALAIAAVLKGDR